MWVGAGALRACGAVVAGPVESAGEGVAGCGVEAVPTGSLFAVAAVGADVDSGRPDETLEARALSSEIGMFRD